MVVAMSVNAALVAIAAAMTWLLPRRAAARQMSPGQGAAADQAPAMSHAPSPARERVVSAAD